MDEPYGLPPGLPVPVDDGACDHLPGMSMPSVRLRSTTGRHVDIAKISARSTVLFFYPAATGKPDMPKEWDLIPGARGCTSQNCEIGRASCRERGERHEVVDMWE